MIYLDNSSTTMMDESVLEEMLPYMTQFYGNPGNIHSFGRKAREKINWARCQVADMIGAKPENIIFTSGGTEANNLALVGVFDEQSLNIVANSCLEHKSVLKAPEYSMRIENNSDGSVSSEAVREFLTKSIAIGVVSVMYSNNETGSVSDVKEIANVCREFDVIFHTDCVQAAGFYDLDVNEIGCDLMSISSHKIHGPKGVGALYVSDRLLELGLVNPIIHGGDDQEFGLRGGTENVPGIVGFGKACQLVTKNIKQYREHMSNVRRIILDGLVQNSAALDWFPEIIVNGQPDRDGKTLNITFPGVDAETLMLALDRKGVIVSAGAACNGSETVPSYVLTNMGVSEELAMCSIRISVSRFTTEEEAHEAVRIITETLEALVR